MDFFVSFEVMLERFGLVFVESIAEITLFWPTSSYQIEDYHSHIVTDSEGRNVKPYLSVPEWCDVTNGLYQEVARMDLFDDVEKNMAEAAEGLRRDSLGDLQ